MKTVLITGCSSGYGLETARYFHSRGWNVVATMRTPREDVPPRSDRLRVVALDVTKPDSIAAALEASGLVDVLVNNAGRQVSIQRQTPASTDRSRLVSVARSGQWQTPGQQNSGLARQSTKAGQRGDGLPFE
jgi:NAD(P)-dependent dehydrogenase (short-subunit alcohol dehydrogenase family)